MSPVDLFRRREPGEQAAARYLEAHVLHTQAEREALAGGWIERASEEHDAARIALRAKLADELDPQPAGLP